MHCALQFWKRKEKLLSLQWGTVSFEENEVERAGENMLARRCCRDMADDPARLFPFIAHFACTLFGD